jgi:glutathione S-transferase
VGSANQERTTGLLRYLDSELSIHPYFAGQAFTAADLMMMFPFFIAKNFLQIDLSPYENIGSYLERIEKRPAYQRAMAIANPPA